MIANLLPNRSLFVLLVRMERIDINDLADILVGTSVSTLAGLLAADPACKAKAAHNLACDIVTRLDMPAEPDRNQLRLPL